MRKTRTTLAYLTIIFFLLTGLLCALHTDVLDDTAQEQLTSTAMDLAKAMAEALREEYKYTYTFPDRMHLYIGEKEDDDGAINRTY